MIITNTNPQTSRAATSAELATLKTELAKSDYTGTSDAQAAQWLNRGKWQDNPAPQPLVLKPVMSANEFFSAIFPAVITSQARLAQNPADPAALEFNAVMGYIQTTAVSEVYLTKSAVAATLQKAVTDGLLTQAQMDADFKIPDPAWPPQVPATMADGSTPFTSRVPVLFPGQRVAVEAADVTAARAS